MAIKYDDFLDPLRKEMEELRRSLEEEKLNILKDAQKLANELKTTAYNKKTKTTYTTGTFEPTTKPAQKETTEHNINDKNLTAMHIGNNNIVEASKYTRFYGYKVKVDDYNYVNKINYAFLMDTSFFKKTFSKPENRFTHNDSRAKYSMITYTYTPKVSKERMKVYKTIDVVEDVLAYFTPFEIKISTEDCHDFVFYYAELDKKEVLKGLYILNTQKVIDKLKSKFKELNLSEKAMNNMISSAKKHLSHKQSTNSYSVDNYYEEFKGFTEDQATMILDDFDNNELLDSLSGYVID